MKTKRIKINEKRRYPRVDEALKISVASDSDQMATETINVSCGGALCTLDHTLPLMTKVAVDLALPKRLIRCTGVVVRCIPQKKKNGLGRRQYQIALYFLDLGREDHRAIAEFVLESMFTHTHAYRRT